MKNKGYTLIELLAVFVILGIIVMITVTIINGTVKSSKESAYKQQINQIENVTRTYMSTHSKELPSLDNGSKCITVETLKNNGLLKNKDIKNPVGQTEDHEEKDEYFDGGVLVHYDGNKYTYKYVDDCNNIDASDLTYKVY